MIGTSMLDWKYPVQTAWVDFELPFVSNETLTWKGQFPLVVDVEGNAYRADFLAMDTPWYYCSCGERQSLRTNFCPKCGAELDWEHTDERDAAADKRFREVLEAKIEELRASNGQEQVSADTLKHPENSSPDA